MDLITALGLVAGGLTTTSLLPQLVKIWRSKSADDVSTKMFMIFAVGVVLWLIYGVIKRDLAVAIANACSLLLAVAILFLKFRYRHKGK